MKRILLLTAAACIVLLTPRAARAAAPVYEAPIGTFGPSFTVQPAVGTWTVVHKSTATLPAGSGPQAAIIVNNPETNTATMHCDISDATGPTWPVSTYTITIAPGVDRLIPISSELRLWCTSASGPQSVHAKYVRQQP